MLLLCFQYNERIYAEECYARSRCTLLPFEAENPGPTLQRLHLSTPQRGIHDLHAAKLPNKIKTYEVEEIKTNGVNEIKTYEVNEIKTYEVNEIKTYEVNEIKTYELDKKQQQQQSALTTMLTEQRGLAGSLRQHSPFLPIKSNFFLRCFNQKPDGLTAHL